jgi:serine/threonine protein kinase
MERIGSYEILEELGRGAMGVVYRGFDSAIGRPVAIKVIRAQSLSTAEEDAMLNLRFAREAAAAGRLSHPNLVTIFQVGDQSGLQYMAMEFVQGRSLEQMLNPGVPMDPKSCVSFLAQVADGLDYAHSEGVVHRDIKPANILIRMDGKVKITDFGIARIASQTITQTGMTMGTPAYMAPEQIKALKVDGKADQFSLAVMAFQMLAGRKPFDADTGHSIMFQIVSVEPPEIHRVNSLLPPASTPVLNRALAKQPEVRFPSCSIFVEALRGALADSVQEVADSKRRAAFSPSGPILSALVSAAAIGAGAWLVFRPPAPTAQVVVQPPAQTPTPSKTELQRPSPAAPDPEAAKRLADEDAFWMSVKDSIDTRDLARYLRVYPQGRFADLARQRLSGLQEEEQRRRIEAQRLTAEAMRTAPSGSRVAVEILASPILDAYFDEGSSSLRADAQVALGQNVFGLKQILKDNPRFIIAIEGHTSENGSAASDLALGDKRANAVKEFLVFGGIPAANLKTISYGRERPICTDHTPECWQKNNRVHFSSGQ